MKEGMRVYAFVGPSGTGKSYRVTELAKRYKVPLIIDDGLLIRSGKAIAGISAKSERTKFASVKRALFFDSGHAETVKTAIQRSGADKIMIVGTSVAMAEKIAAVLHLPQLYKVIRIDEVSTAEEMEKARQVRKEEGKHVIPVPTFQIRKDFSGYWLDPLQIFRPQSRRREGEKTLVRPTYSYLGDFTISHGVLVTIGAHETKQFPEVTRLWICSAEERGKSLIFHLEMNLRHGVSIPEVTERIRNRVKAAVTEYTGFWVEDVRITVRSLDTRKNMGRE